MKVFDFLKGLDKYVKENENFSFAILKDCPEMKAKSVLLRWDYYNRINKRQHELDLCSIRPKTRGAFGMEVSEISCSACDGIQYLDFIVAEQPEKSMEEILDAFVKKYDCNPYYQQYLECIKNYAEEMENDFCLDR